MRMSSRDKDLVPFDHAPEISLHRRKAIYQEVLAPADLQTLESLHKVFSTEPPSYEEDIIITLEAHTSPPPPIMRKLQDASKPTQAQIPMGSTMPDITTRNFKVDSGLIRYFQESQFGVADNEDPAQPISNFIDLYNTIKHEGVEPKQLREMMFPFSLRDKSKKWFNTLNQVARGITDWDTLVMAYYEEYFSAEKTALLRSKITGFRQMADETLFEVWEKYNSVLNSCPHHGLEGSFLYTQFYHSLNPESKQILDSAFSNGIFSNIEADQARDTIDRMARHSYVNRLGKSTAKGKHHVDSSTLLEANLLTQIN
ncbi:hypothetical protein vseg_007902 [Gypsophila vaccaria]